jgi:hypothetical protein
MQKITQTHTKQTFNEWYEGLPANKQKEYREMIMEKLEIKIAMFYHIKNGLRKINQAEKDCINSIADQVLTYPDDVDVTSSLELVKA